MKKHLVNQLIASLAKHETGVVGRQFIAAKSRGVDVNVRIGGAVCTMRTRPRRYEGFGIFQAMSLTKAQLVREATLVERTRYFRLLPQLALIVQARHGGQWMGVFQDLRDRCLLVDCTVPIQLALDVQPFDFVNVRFDGNRYWFEQLDPSHSPITASALRDALDHGVSPRALRIRGLTPREREVYAGMFQQRYAPRPVEELVVPDGVPVVDLVEQRLQSNLEHAGGELVDYFEHADGYRVRYQVDGIEHVSSLSKDDLTVQSAGFCLDDMDEQFDLTSLIGVVREGHRSGGIFYHE